ncbi:molybdenum cofactor guanylyltransferase [Deinococcus radiotolerans]|uniref:Probable molybdenum cofactor guanylyltransferase n=1 Tax=Deinococcus radiotolerans TaxID=1309407 RepID=A0ABQ2FHU7_9DEIO|nr:molybdenum cofactor guanylyltransferase [Deinococcus radiotolerans]GGK96752.1 putative molybdenum cofactor guanylyltransferase [Deinococcus radiotolerans]
MTPTGPWADVTGVVTAGGRSSRFGSDKALAVWEGRTLLEHACAPLALAPTRLLIAPAGRYHVPGWTVTPDTRPGEGPLAALEAALNAAPDGWVAFTGVDLPGLTRTYWEALLAARTPGLLSVQALDDLNRPQPLAALYHTGLRAHLTGLLDQGERRLRLAAPTARVRHVPVTDPDCLRNVNTPADLPGPR